MAGTMNKAIIVGKLGRDPEVRYAQSGNPIGNLNVATDESYTDRAGNRVDMWRQKGNNAGVVKLEWR